VEAAPGALLLVDASALILAHSGGAARLLAPSALLGQQLSSVLAGCEPLLSGSVELQVPDPQGYPRALVVEGASLATQDGPLSLLSLRDAPGDGAASFRAIVEAAPCAMVVVDRAQTITTVNRSFELMFGYPRQELLGQPLERIIPPRLRVSHQRLVQRFTAAPTARQMGPARLLFGLRRDGSEIPVEIGLSPLRSEQGELTVASIIDVSERQAEAERFHRMVLAAPIAMIMLNPTGAIALVNRRAEELFGYAPGELLGLQVDALIPGRAGAGQVEEGGHWLERRELPIELGIELGGLRKDGSPLSLEVGLSPLESRQGDFILATMIDASQRKQQEAELRRSNADLEQFAYVASHDLQEPLRMVASYTELLAQRYQGRLDEKADKYIFYAVDGAKRMQRLVADLLAYARVGSQGKPLVPVDSEGVVHGVLGVLGPTIRAEGAQLLVGKLPTVLADEVQLRQLFQNLIGNALKFRSAAPPQIVIRAELKDEDWLYSIQDNGIGIEMQYGDRVFQMFQRLHERGKYEGSGIGLAIAKRILDRHGGKIWLESQVGAGTTFFFTLRAPREPS
jgi:PAS domain S-box-containing protein